jgi:ATP-binding cassette, subfamily B, bacterial
MRKKVLKYLWPYRIPFIIALGQVFVISVFEILKPWPFKVVIDHVLSDKPVP